MTRGGESPCESQNTRIYVQDVLNLLHSTIYALCINTFVGGDSSTEAEHAPKLRRFILDSSCGVDVEDYHFLAEGERVLLFQNRFPDCVPASLWARLESSDVTSSVKEGWLCSAMLDIKPSMHPVNCTFILHLHQQQQRRRQSS